MHNFSYYKNKYLFSILMFLVTLAFYLFFAFYDGAIIYPDSQTYIEMDLSREPFYPLFLAFFRLFSTENYLLYAVIAQSLMMALAGWKLADYLKKQLHIPNLYSLILYAMPIATSLLCRFAAKRAAMYTNSILTEGICTSLYLFFIYCILKCLWEHSKLHLILSWCTAFIMISTRKQMLMVLPILFFSMVYANYFKRRFLKNIVTAAIVCILTLPCFVLFDCTYNYVLRGTFQRHTSSNRFISTMVFYNALPSDAEYIEDTEVRQLFLDICSACDESGYSGSHAGDGWFQEVNHFGDHYDLIQINTMYPMIYQQARENIYPLYEDANLTETEFGALCNMETDRLTSIIVNSVLPHQIPKLIKTLFNNFLSGLVITVAQLRQILVPYTVIMFLLYLVLTGRLAMYWHKNRNCNIASIALAEKNVVFSLITLTGIFFNVLLVSAVIFCQTRYTIYNMPLFYMAGAVLLYQNLILPQKQT